MVEPSSTCLWIRGINVAALRSATGYMLFVRLLLYISIEFSSSSSSAGDANGVGGTTARSSSPVGSVQSTEMTLTRRRRRGAEGG